MLSKDSNTLFEYGSKDDIIDNIWSVYNDLDSILSLFVCEGINLKQTDIIDRLKNDMKYLDSMELKVKQFLTAKGDLRYA